MSPPNSVSFHNSQQCVFCAHIYRYFLRDYILYLTKGMAAYNGPGPIGHLCSTNNMTKSCKQLVFYRNSFFSVNLSRFPKIFCVKILPSWCDGFKIRIAGFLILLFLNSGIIRVSYRIRASVCMHRFFRTNGTHAD